MKRATVKALCIKAHPAADALGRHIESFAGTLFIFPSRMIATMASCCPGVTVIALFATVTSVALDRPGSERSTPMGRGRAFVPCVVVSPTPCLRRLGCGYDARRSAML